MSESINTSGNYQLSPIGIFKTSLKYTYDAARQGLEDSENISCIELNSELPAEQMLRGLDGFSRIWVIFLFHKNNHWNPMVSPPRVPENGPQKMGVFATRSPHRPNFIGMSALKLIKIEGRKIYVSGADILDESPVLDIKPYIVYADSFPNESRGWLDQLGTPYNIQISETARAQIQFLKSDVPHLEDFIFQQLEYNPLNCDKKRVEIVSDNSQENALGPITFAKLAYRTWRAEFEVLETEHKIIVKNILSGYSSEDLNSKEDPYTDKALHRKFNSEFK